MALKCALLFGLHLVHASLDLPGGIGIAVPAMVMEGRSHTTAFEPVMLDLGRLIREPSSEVRFGLLGRITKSLSNALSEQIDAVFGKRKSKSKVSSSIERSLSLGGLALISWGAAAQAKQGTDAFVQRLHILRRLNFLPICAAQLLMSASSVPQALLVRLAA